MTFNEQVDDSGFRDNSVPQKYSLGQLSPSQFSLGQTNLVKMQPRALILISLINILLPIYWQLYILNSLYVCLRLLVNKSVLHPSKEQPFILNTVLTKPLPIYLIKINFLSDTN